MQLSAQDYAEIVATLQAAEADSSDKRRFTRMQVRGRIVVTPITPEGQAGASYTALTRDISFQGAGLMQTIPVQLGQNILAYFPRRGRPGLCMLCKVVHIRPLADGLLAVGCEFLAPAEPGASKLPQPGEAANAAQKTKAPAESVPNAVGEAEAPSPAEQAAAAEPVATPAPGGKPAPARPGNAPSRSPTPAAH
jgi:hypothetical protein